MQIFLKFSYWEILLYGQLHYGLFTLWTVSLLYAFIDERCKNKIPLILISIICIGAIGWGLRNNHNIPYNLGASCTAYVYYAFGSIYKRKVKNFIDKLGNWEIFGLSILAILLYYTHL